MDRPPVIDYIREGPKSFSWGEILVFVVIVGIYTCLCVGR